MSTEANRKLVEKASQAWVQGDGGAIIRLLDDEARWTVIGSTPISRTYTGRRDFIDNALKPLGKLLDGAITPSVRAILADGDHVVLLWEGTGTMRSGRPYHNQYSWVMRFENGRIVEGTAYLDTELVSALFD